MKVELPYLDGALSVLTRSTYGTLEKTHARFIVQAWSAKRCESIDFGQGRPDPCHCNPCRARRALAGREGE